MDLSYLLSCDLISIIHLSTHLFVTDTSFHILYYQENLFPFLCMFPIIKWISCCINTVKNKVSLYIGTYQQTSTIRLCAHQSNYMEEGKKKMITICIFPQNWARSWLYFLMCVNQNTMQISRCRISSLQTKHAKSKLLTSLWECTGENIINYLKCCTTPYLYRVIK